MNTGTKVHATIKSSDSFYAEVRGTVTGERNGRVLIEATEVMDKWSRVWKAHPTSCRMSAPAGDVRPV